jgi:hypothetical protein
VILVGTGHRPDKIGSHKRQVCEEISRRLDALQPDLVINGLAVGFDQWLLEEALHRGIRVIGAIPFPGQGLRWPGEVQARYQVFLKWIINQGGELEFVSRVDPVSDAEADRMLKARDFWMVNRALQIPAPEKKVLLACYNGDLHGGTITTIRYARAKCMELSIFDPYTLRSRHPRTLEMI